MDRDPPIRSDINVTPLVDVCLVLLIIFMVVTPMMVDGVQVAVPETRAPRLMPERRDELEVAIGDDGAVYVGEDPVPAQALGAALRATFHRLPGASVVVKADRRLRYEQVRDLMRMLGEAGWDGAGIETRKLQEGDS